MATTIEMPAELLEMILRYVHLNRAPLDYVGSLKRLYKVSRVCRSWYSTIECMYGDAFKAERKWHDSRVLLSMEFDAMTSERRHESRRDHVRGTRFGV